MATTLTREAFLGKTSSRYEEVEIPGWGTVGIRSISPLRAARRASQLFDDNGKYQEAIAEKRLAYMVIDQLMLNEDEPMFSETDIDLFDEMDQNRLEPILAAIRDFNGEGDEGNEAEPSNSNGN